MLAAPKRTGVPLGNVAVNHVGEPAALLIHEGAAIDHQHVVAPVDENAHRQALALPQAGRLLRDETQPRGDLAGDDLGRYAADHALPVLAAALQVGGHAGPQVARQTLGHLDFDFQRGQIDYRQQRRVLGDTGAIGDLHLAHVAIDR